MNERRHEAMRARQSSMQSVRRIRWVLIALTAVLAVALLANGNYLIGGLLAAIVIARVVMVTKLEQRRREWHERQPGDASIDV